jgi:hypothetical protein
VSPLRADQPLDHARHDPALIASLLDRDAEITERRQAEALVAACATCRSLATELRSLSRALSSELPVPRRSRDFRLTPEMVDARRSPLARLLAAFAGPRASVLQPLGAAVLSVGIGLFAISSVGLLPTESPAGGRETAAQVSAPTDSAATDTSSGRVGTESDQTPGGAEPSQQVAGAQSESTADPTPAATTATRGNGAEATKPPADAASPTPEPEPSPAIALAPSPAATEGTGYGIGSAPPASPPAATTRDGAAPEGAGPTIGVQVFGLSLAFLGLLTLALRWVARRFEGPARRGA